MAFDDITKSIRNAAVPIHPEGRKFIAIFAAIAVALFLLWEPRVTSSFDLDDARLAQSGKTSLLLGASLPNGGQTTGDGADDNRRATKE